MQTYETLFIINPDLEESAITQAIDMVQDTITSGGGKIIKVDRWGRRQLAYQIQNKQDGYYVLIYFQAPPSLIATINRRCKLNDSIMRYLVLQLRKKQAEEVLRSAEMAAEPTMPEEPTDVSVQDTQNLEQPPTAEDEANNEPVPATEEDA